jgi:hypothetical protein
MLFDARMKAFDQVLFSIIGEGIDEGPQPIFDPWESVADLLRARHERVCRFVERRHARKLEAAQKAEAQA